MTQEVILDIVSDDIVLDDVTEEVVITLGDDVGPRGRSAYEIAVANGFVGTEEEWLASLEGPPGAAFDPSALQADIDAVAADLATEVTDRTDADAALAAQIAAIDPIPFAIALG